MATGSQLRADIGEVFAHAAGNETPILSGRALKIVRAVILAVFVAATLLYVLDVFALWDEAHRLEYTEGDPASGTSTVNYFGLTAQERELLTGSSAEVPGWYPVFVVTRQIVLTVAAVAIAWLIYSRRPRHWMAYMTTLFILLAPVMGLIIRDYNRLEDSLGGPLYIALVFAAVITLFSFLWLFPDGRFRQPLFWLFGWMVALLLFAVVASWVGPGAAEIEDSDVGMWVAGAWWLTLLATILFWGMAGIAVQIWRYRHTPLADRRLARWNLAFLIAVPLWFMPSDAFHDVLGEEDENLDDMFGFVWEQIHETLYLLAPVLLGIWVLFLVRRQGWWDFQTLWNRTAVYGIGLIVLAALYGAVIGLVSVAASPLAATGEQAIAVIAATAIVAFSYGPVLARVRAWVDERWFPKRAEVDATALAFAAEVRSSNSPSTVPEQLRTTIQDSLDPEHVELWTVEGGDQR